MSELPRMTFSGTSLGNNCTSPNILSTPSVHSTMIDHEPEFDWADITDLEVADALKGGASCDPRNVLPRPVSPTMSTRSFGSDDDCVIINTPKSSNASSPALMAVQLGIEADSTQDPLLGEHQADSDVKPLVDFEIGRECEQEGTANLTNLIKPCAFGQKSRTVKGPDFIPPTLKRRDAISGASSGEQVSFSDALRPAPILPRSVVAYPLQQSTMAMTDGLSNLAIAMPGAPADMVQDSSCDQSRSFSTKEPTSSTPDLYEKKGALVEDIFYDELSGLTRHPSRKLQHRAFCLSGEFGSSRQQEVEDDAISLVSEPLVVKRSLDLTLTSGHHDYHDELKSLAKEMKGSGESMGIQDLSRSLEVVEPCVNMGTEPIPSSLSAKSAVPEIMAQPSTSPAAYLASSNSIYGDHGDRDGSGIYFSRIEVLIKHLQEQMANLLHLSISRPEIEVAEIYDRYKLEELTLSFLKVKDMMPDSIDNVLRNHNERMAELKSLVDALVESHEKDTGDSRHLAHEIDEENGYASVPASSQNDGEFSTHIAFFDSLQHNSEPDKIVPPVTPNIQDLKNELLELQFREIEAKREAKKHFSNIKKLNIYISHQVDEIYTLKQKFANAEDFAINLGQENELLEARELKFNEIISGQAADTQYNLELMAGLADDKYQLQEQVGVLRERLSTSKDLQKRLHNLDMENGSLSWRMEELREILYKLKEEKRDLEMKAESEKSKLLSNYSDRCTTIDHLLQTKFDLQKQIKAREGDVDDMDSRIAEQDVYIGQLERDAERMAEMDVILTECGAEISKLKGENVLLEAATYQFNSRIHKLDTELEGKNNTLETEIYRRQQAEARVSELERIIDDQKYQLENRNTSSSVQETNLSAALKKSQESLYEIKILKGQKDYLQARVTDLVDCKDSLTAENAKLLFRVQELKYELSNVTSSEMNLKVDAEERCVGWSAIASETRMENRKRKVVDFREGAFPFTERPTERLGGTRKQIEEGSPNDLEDGKNATRKANRLMSPLAKRMTPGKFMLPTFSHIKL